MGEFVVCSAAAAAAAAVFLFCAIFSIFSYLFVYFLSHFFMSGSFLSSFFPPEKSSRTPRKTEVNVWWVQGRTSPKFLYILLTPFCGLFVAAFGMLSISLPNTKKE
jgi:hypothetical protein